MLTEKDYCDYDTCVALKKLGYKEKTLAYYTSEGIFYWRRAYIYDVAIPDLAKSSNSNKELRKHVLDAVSLYEAQKWLREEKKIVIVLVPYSYNSVNETNTWSYEIWMEDNLECEANDFNSYNESLSEGIKKAVEILKKMQK